jgi:putative chitinase
MTDNKQPFWSKLAGKIPDSILTELTTIVPLFDIDGPKRLSNLLGQAHHESGGFKQLYENLNYSAQSLANTWPTRYAVDSKAKDKVPNDLAKKLQRKPEAIANNCYANRIGNGNETSGDGWLYRGRGYLQTTGKDNYKALGNYLKIDLIKNPDLVATMYPLASAAFFFMNNVKWTLCDQGTDAMTIERITRKVNGGLHGLDERIKHTQLYHKLLTG